MDAREYWRLSTSHLTNQNFPVYAMSQTYVYIWNLNALRDTKNGWAISTATLHKT